MTGFEKRPLGRSALEVTALGLGCATLGGSRVPVRREEAEAIVRAAWAAGVRYVDTAPFYGFGQAERCVGDALRDVPRDEWVLSTKVGRLLCPNPSAAEHQQNRMPFDAAFDYSYDAIMRSFEDSLQRLGLGRIDILYVHDIGVMQHGREVHAAIMRTLRGGGYRAIEELRRCGVVRAIGIGVNEREVLLEAMEWGAWDAFLLAGRYTLLEQAPLDDLLPKCLSSGISIVVGGPLNSGILAGRDTWNYTTAPSEIVGRVDAIRAVCDCHQECLWPQPRCNFPSPTLRSRRSSRVRAASRNSRPT
jgi:D-threo-aldose 1-dehydrogenase